MASTPRTAFGRMLRQTVVDSGYNLIGLAFGIVSFTLIVTGISAGLSLLVIGVGLPILTFTMFIARGLGDVHRVSLAAVVRRPSPRPLYVAAPEGAGWFRRMVNPLLCGQSWLDVTAGFIDLPFAIVAFTFTVV